MSRIALVFALALGLTACSERGVTPARVATADSADQVMSGMGHTITRDGVKSTYLEADSAWVFQAREVTERKGIKVTFYSPKGAVRSVITADTGTYHMRDGTLDARGNVVAVTPPPDSGPLKTEHLLFDRVTNVITSDTAYSYVSRRGNGSGASFETDPDFRRFRTWQPKGRQRGQGFELPGQDSAGP